MGDFSSLELLHIKSSCSKQQTPAFPCEYLTIKMKQKVRWWALLDNAALICHPVSWDICWITLRTAIFHSLALLQIYLPLMKYKQYSRSNLELAFSFNSTWILLYYYIYKWLIRNWNLQTFLLCRAVLEAKNTEIGQVQTPEWRFRLG